MAGRIFLRPWAALLVSRRRLRLSRAVSSCHGWMRQRLMSCSLSWPFVSLKPKLGRAARHPPAAIPVGASFATDPYLDAALSSVSKL
jgi:hypothetical protein